MCAVRLEAEAKVTGRAKYAADLFFPGMVHLKVVRSPLPHALIKSIDASEALKVEGVLSVFTGADFPGRVAQERERPVLARDRVRYVGDGVAVVVAENEEAAEEGARRVRVEYEPLPAVLDPLEALKPDAPKVHGESNVICHHVVQRGNPEEGFAEAEVVLERTYRTHRVQHAALEVEAAVAVPEGDHMVVYCPGKSPFNARRIVAEALGWPLNRVIIRETTIGGSFGGKDYDMGVLAARAALAANRLGRPARIKLTREESTVEGTKRHPYVLKYKVGAKKDGTLCAMEVYGVADGGAYVSKTPLVTWRSAVEATGPYRIPHVQVDIYGVFTNNVYADALRGFGSPQVDFAVELLMDELAGILELDPLELRLRNGLREGDTGPTGQVMRDVSLATCLRRVTDAAGWAEKRQAYVNQKGYRRRGIGLACSFRGSCFGAGGEGLDAAGAALLVHRDGTADLSCGIVEVGQGSRTVFARIVEEVLGLPLDRIHVNALDTARVPDSGPTVASRGTVIGGNAVLRAAEQVRRAMEGVAAEMLGCSPGEVTFRAGQVAARDRCKALAFEEVAAECYRRGVSLYGFGWYKAPDLPWDRSCGQGEAYFGYVYAASVAEVEVDLETGQVEVLGYYAAHDVGRALNPAEVEGQICGGAAMGIGYALMEDVGLAGGEVRNTNYDRYLLPTCLDVGTLVPIIVEEPCRFGPLGARGLGEPATQIVAPAIVNAICQAIGGRLYEIPATLEAVLSKARGR
ncbi:MAG: xanthine dehydrogenase family protein [Thermoanaerobacteraceae bacterium]|nr:xanthine dehydrogenase family protein [Thermoanaerobacteraceae bacterium]